VIRLAFGDGARYHPPPDACHPKKANCGRNIMSMQSVLCRLASEPVGRRAAIQGAAAAGLAWATTSFLSRPSSAAQDLLVFDFTGYDVPDLHQPYIRKYGASPTFALYGDGDEAFLKLQGGFRADLVHPGAFDAGRFRDAGLLQPWDTARLSNWPDVYPILANTAGAVHDGKQWMIPADWGINSVLYRTDLVDIEEESWTLLWDKRYAGKLAYGTEMYPAIGGAALALGIANPFQATDEEFDRIRAKLAEQRPLLRFYWSDPTELEQAVASGEVVAAWAWSASYSMLKAQGVPVKYMQPKEGVSSWVGGFLRLKDAPGNEQNAYDFVDAWLAPETGKWMIENYGYGHTNRKAFDLVDPAVVADKGLGLPDKILANSLPNQEMSLGLRERYVRMYEEVRAGM
jgi:spermidine/putrescine transport system substrate-binding protein